MKKKTVEVQKKIADVKKLYTPFKNNIQRKCKQILKTMISFAYEGNDSKIFVTCKLKECWRIVLFIVLVVLFIVGAQPVIGSNYTL